jgi:hypothetical protein
MRLRSRTNVATRWLIFFSHLPVNLRIGTSEGWVRTANSRRKKAPELAGSHSSKLWHRAPLEIGFDLSHVRETLESGVPVLPKEASLDAAGQWLLCCAGASPTEGPFQFRREGRTPTNVLKQSNSGPFRVSSGKRLIMKKSCQDFIKIFLLRAGEENPFHLSTLSEARRGIPIARPGHL